MAQPRGGLAREVGEQRRHVLRPLAQRRQVQAHHVEPVEEVGAELALLDRLLERLGGGGDDADVHLARLAPADPADLALLEHAEQLGLQVERQVADLVEQQRALVRQLEQAGRSAVAPVNAPFAWPNSSLSSSCSGIAAQLMAVKLALAPAGSSGGWRGPAPPCRCRSRR